MAAITKDDIWKLFTLGMSVLILPLAGWVWNTHTMVIELQNDLGDVERLVDDIEVKIVELDNNTKQIIGLEKDLEYMKDTLGRIEKLVTER
jgi:hypothetical protein